MASTTRGSTGCSGEPGTGGGVDAELRGESAVPAHPGHDTTVDAEPSHVPDTSRGGEVGMPAFGTGPAPGNGELVTVGTDIEDKLRGAPLSCLTVAADADSAGMPPVNGRF